MKHTIQFTFLVLCIAGLLNACIQSSGTRFRQETGSDYQLYIESADSLAVYDGSRRVGTVFLTDDSEIGQLIQNDNE